MERAVRMLTRLAKAVGDALSAFAMQPGNARELQNFRDALLAYKKNSAVWIQGVGDRKSVV